MATNSGTQQQNKETQRRGGGLLGCLLAPIVAPLRLIFRQFSFAILAFAIAFGAVAACGLFAPLAFQNFINAIRNTGFQVVSFVLGSTGRPVLKVITYDVDVHAYAQVNRDMGILGLAFGQGATVEGYVRVSMGGNLETRQFGIMACDINTDSIRTSSGSAPLAGFAFDLEQIEQEAYDAFKEVAANDAIQKYWPATRDRLRDQLANSIEGWQGIEVPDEPSLVRCPANIAPDPANGTATSVP